MKKNFFKRGWKFHAQFFTCLVLITNSFIGCRQKTDNVPSPSVIYETYSDTNTLPNIGTRWADMTLKVIDKASLNTPTYCSRALGYMGLTMYEAVVHARPDKKSIASNLSGLTDMPIPDKRFTYKWELSCNAAQASMLNYMYGYTSTANVHAIDSLKELIESEYDTTISQDEKLRSIKFGEDVADAIYKWSKTDGGHEGYLKNFPAYTVPDVLGAWVPNLENSQSPSPLPLHPYWGKNRTFSVNNSSIPMPAIATYSSDPSSECYKQFKEVYDKTKILTQEEKEIALWWGDDPSKSYSPGGHSYNIAKIAINAQRKIDLVDASETFAMTGMALADAFINCWKCKYEFVRERPASYIKKYIEPNWLSFWPEPPFPSFISGHSTQGMAAAVILEARYGASFKFVDNTNLGSPKDETRNVDYKARTYSSFRQFAIECADSRFYGGIHIKHDNEMGALIGEKVAQNIIQLFK